MVDFLTNLLDTSGFPPRWYCGSWTTSLGLLHILSDLCVWSAYLAIPCVLVYFAVRRRDVPFRFVFLLFGAFILACGTTHLMDAIVFWWPAYRLAGVFKLLTALVSWGTVFALVRVGPKAFTLGSPEEVKREARARRRVEELNEQLHREIKQRTWAVSCLRQSERRYRSLVEASTAIVWNMPSSGLFESEQPGWSRFTGQRREELLGWGIRPRSGPRLSPTSAYTRWNSGCVVTTGSIGT
jgi:PAS domain-containing protein